MARVVIIGAGISGLALAFRLQQRTPHHAILVLEQDSRAGGKVWTLQSDGFRVEAGPNGFLDTKPSTLALCRDLGLADRLVTASESSARNRYLFMGNRLRPLPRDVPSFLTSDLLSWRGKLDLALERVRDRPRPKGDESVGDFARRHAGNEIAEVLADALVTGIYAGDPEHLSLSATFPRLAEFERRHGSVLKGFAQEARQRRAQAPATGQETTRPGRMWSFREGLGLLIDTLQDRLKPPPLLGVGVRSIRHEGSPDHPTWRISAPGRENWTADAVVLTCPAYQQAALLADLDAELAEHIHGIAHNRVVVIALGYRRSDVRTRLDGFGYIAPQRSGRDLLGVQWCSSIFPDRAPADAVLLRALAGGWRQPEIAGWDDARLLDAARAELRLAMGITAAPIFHQIIRWNRAIPQYLVGHWQRVAWIEHRLARHPGLFLGGNAYHGVALNDCTEQAGVLAERVTEEVRRLVHA